VVPFAMAPPRFVTPPHKEEAPHITEADPLNGFLQSPGHPAGCNEPLKGLRAGCFWRLPVVPRPGRRGRAWREISARARRWGPAFRCGKNRSALLFAIGGTRRLPSAAAARRRRRPSGGGSGHDRQACRIGAGLPVPSDGQRRARPGAVKYHLGQGPACNESARCQAPFEAGQIASSDETASESRQNESARSPALQPQGANGPRGIGGFPQTRRRGVAGMGRECVV